MSRLIAPSRLRTSMWQASILSLWKSVHLHLRPICWKLQNTCHIAFWHRSWMSAWKNKDSYILLGVVIFRRVILHLKEEAAWNKWVFSAQHKSPAWKLSESRLPLSCRWAELSIWLSEWHTQVQCQVAARCVFQTFAFNSRAGVPRCLCMGSGSCSAYSWKIQTLICDHTHIPTLEGFSALSTREGRSFPLDD